MSTQPVQYIELLGQLPVMAVIYAVFKAVPNEITVDIYKILRQAIYRTPEEKLDLANKKSDVLKKNAGVVSADIFLLGTGKETLSQALHADGMSKLDKTLEEQKDDNANRSP